MTDNELIQDLVGRVPELKPLYDEHIKDNGELLSHYFFGDLTRYIVSNIDTGVVTKILSILDETAKRGGNEELIRASFIENLSDDSKETIDKIKEMSGPHLKEGFQYM